MESSQSVNEPAAQHTDAPPVAAQHAQQEPQGDRTADNDPPPQTAETAPAAAGGFPQTDIYEVRGSTATLLSHLQEGTIAWPPPMEWQAWLSWRSRDGMRPRQHIDGYWTTNGFETHLHSAVMAFKYGDDWRSRMRSRAPGMN